MDVAAMRSSLFKLRGELVACGSGWVSRGAEMNAAGNRRDFWELIYPFSEYKSVIYPLYALDLYPRE